MEENREEQEYREQLAAELWEVFNRNPCRAEFVDLTRTSRCANDDRLDLYRGVSPFTPWPLNHRWYAWPGGAWPAGSVGGGATCLATRFSEESSFCVFNFIVSLASAALMDSSEIFLSLAILSI